jgi:hypothetical protein
LYTHQHWGNDDSMYAVDPDAVDALQPGERGALLIHKTRIGPQFGYGAAGFDPTKDVLLR